VLCNSSAVDDRNNTTAAMARMNRRRRVVIIYYEYPKSSVKSFALIFGCLGSRGRISSFLTQGAPRRAMFWMSRFNDDWCADSQ